MRPVAILVLGVVAMLGVGCGKSEKDAIQGTWSVESWDEPSRHGPAAPTKGLKFVFSADKLTFNNGSDTTEDPYKIDSNASPKTIDVTQTRESMVGNGHPPTPMTQTNTIRGIYTLDGDTLKLCFGPEDSGRPTEFESKPGRVLIVLKRT